MIEKGSVASWRWMYREGGTLKNTKKLLGMMEMFAISFVGMVLFECTLVKTEYIVYYKYVWLVYSVISQ